MSFSEVVEDSVFGRPRVELPIEKIFELHNQGYSCRRIVKELARAGIKTSKDTVNRRLQEKGDSGG